ncbi:M23 family metallopeptidase [Solibacillus daqui]|uniref:M23 family metallopeptidase n=1 Tax=Solibacillus daqui TaxID=2912187 RepID=UPI0023654343|nr:M23 family metallopeptidase [Solibacillus daqui]
MEPVTNLKQTMGQLFLAQQFEEVYRVTTTEFQHYVTYDQFLNLAIPFVEGVEQFRLEHEANLPYSKQMIWLDDMKTKAIVVAFNPANEIESLFLTPFTIDEQANKRYTKNTYHYPFKGEWFVFWGGTNELINYHYAYESQRFAYDFVKVQDGLTYHQTPERNDMYFAYNEEILAPLEGTVIEVVDGIVDNIPGQMDEQNPAGNFVIIEHANKEYSLLAHLIPSSITVRVGQHVKTGETIGRCGNSGNSSETHLHFQVMDTPSLASCKSLRIRFNSKQEPLQGDTIKSKI